ncbi:hypothetical protein PR048_007203 [Dryococelus australis]|uniref:Uncharacterized protein n=1 Tax=Dryococelus australis TaxID=614101 RepID=A0ABQ9IDZ2_9NEOP|nr:hypothetical protein PR048_007203 [Dryococelus australis]
MKGRGETGDPRENPPTDGIVRHDSHILKCSFCREQPISDKDDIGARIKGSVAAKRKAQDWRVGSLLVRLQAPVYPKLLCSFKTQERWSDTGTEKTPLLRQTDWNVPTLFRVLEAVLIERLSAIGHTHLCQRDWPISAYSSPIADRQAVNLKACSHHNNTQQHDVTGQQYVVTLFANQRPVTDSPSMRNLFVALCVSDTGDTSTHAQWPIAPTPETRNGLASSPLLRSTLHITSIDRYRRDLSFDAEISALEHRSGEISCPEIFRQCRELPAHARRQFKVIQASHPYARARSRFLSIMLLKAVHDEMITIEINLRKMSLSVILKESRPSTVSCHRTHRHEAQKYFLSQDQLRPDNMGDPRENLADQRASSGTISTYENSRATPRGIEPGSPRCEARSLTTTPLQRISVRRHCRLSVEPRANKLQPVRYARGQLLKIDYSLSARRSFDWLHYAKVLSVRVTSCPEDSPRYPPPTPLTIHPLNCLCCAPLCTVVHAFTPDKLTRKLMTVSGGSMLAERLDCPPPTKANRIQSPAGSLRIFVSGNRAGRCRWSIVFFRGVRRYSLGPLDAKSAVEFLFDAIPSSRTFRNMWQSPVRRASRIQSVNGYALIKGTATRNFVPVVRAGLVPDWLACWLGWLPAGKVSHRALIGERSSHVLLECGALSHWCEIIDLVKLCQSEAEGYPGGGVFSRTSGKCEVTANGPHLTNPTTNCLRHSTLN